MLGQKDSALSTLFCFEAIYRPFVALANGLQTNAVTRSLSLVYFGVTKHNNHCATHSALQ